MAGFHLSRRSFALGTAAAMVLPLSWATTRSFGQQEPDAADAFFRSLLPGGADSGTIYLEIPLKASLLPKTPTDEERLAAWKSFFERAVKETLPDYTSPEYHSDPRTPYWGEFVYGKIDVPFVAGSVEWEIGDIVNVRTEAGVGSATITGYTIHHSGAATWDLLLAVAQPLAGFKVHDTDLLVAARKLPACKAPCVNRRESPRPSVLEMIQETAGKGAKSPIQRRPEELIALQGHFTRHDRPQFFVYIYFGRDDEGPLGGYWRTLVLDTDLTIISNLGENEYAHIKPRSIADINGDGLDEIWVDLVGYEGQHAGILYWRGGSGKKAFGQVVTLYSGL